MTARKERRQQCSIHHVRRSEHRHISQKDKQPCEMARNFKDK